MNVRCLTERSSIWLSHLLFRSIHRTNGIILLHWCRDVHNPSHNRKINLPRNILHWFNKGNLIVHLSWPLFSAHCYILDIRTIFINHSIVLEATTILLVMLVVANNTMMFLRLFYFVKFLFRYCYALILAQCLRIWICSNFKFFLVILLWCFSYHNWNVSHIKSWFIYFSFAPRNEFRGQFFTWASSLSSHSCNRR